MHLGNPLGRQYVVIIDGCQPVAVALMDAKKNTLPPGHSLNQAKAYAHCKRLNVPFVYSSNGHQFVEFDRFTGLTSAPHPMAEFPTPDALRGRYEQGQGFRLDDEAAKPLLVPYHSGEGGRRYYQDAAIRAVLEKVAQCQHTGEPRRALLPLATGSGKTFQYLHEQSGTDGMTHVLVESRGKKEDADLELAFRRICDGANYHGKRLPFEAIFVDKKQNLPGLQLADLVCHPIGRHLLKPEQENRAYEVVEKKFRRSGGGKLEGYGLKTFP